MAVRSAVEAPKVTSTRCDCPLFKFALLMPAKPYKPQGWSVSKTTRQADRLSHKRLGYTPDCGIKASIRSMGGSRFCWRARGAPRFSREAGRSVFGSGDRREEVSVIVGHPEVLQLAPPLNFLPGPCVSARLPCPRKSVSGL